MPPDLYAVIRGVQRGHGEPPDAAATLTPRYISNRFLPDTAIDLIDEASAGLKMEVESLPPPIDERERIVAWLERSEASPITYQPMAPAGIVLDRALRDEINEALEGASAEVRAWAEARGWRGVGRPREPDRACGISWAAAAPRQYGANKKSLG